MSRPRFRSLALLVVLGLIVVSCGDRRDDSNDSSASGGGGGTAGEGAGAIDASNCPDTGTAGIEGDTIKLVSSFPQSGLTAPFSEISKGYKAYFQMVNDEQGGVEVNGKKY